MHELQDYEYGGARSLVLLHEQQLRKFHVVWQAAKEAGVVLSATDDPSYASLETILRHVLYCAASYMIWMCEVLELPDPEIRPAPEAEVAEAEAESYLEHLIERWRIPLADLTEGECYYPAYTSRWNVSYCIDAMLEHAAMHPMRHRFQLEELLAASEG